MDDVEFTEATRLELPHCVLARTLGPAVGESRAIPLVGNRHAVSAEHRFRSQITHVGDLRNCRPRGHEYKLTNVRSACGRYP